MFIAEGEKIVKDFLQSNLKYHSILASELWVENNAGEFDSNLLTVVSNSEIKKLTSFSSPPEVMMIAEMPENSKNVDLNTGTSFYLDDIRDPGNMGTILRTAAWFGIQHLFCSEECVDRYNPKVVQASMGAVIHVNIEVQSLVDLKTKFPDLPILAASSNGSNLYTAEIPKPALIIIGNESKGIRQEWLNEADQLISIPGADNETSESLNAAVAAGVIMSYLFQKK